MAISKEADGNERATPVLFARDVDEKVWFCSVAQVPRVGQSTLLFTWDCLQLCNGFLPLVSLSTGC